MISAMFESRAASLDWCPAGLASASTPDGPVRSAHDMLLSAHSPIQWVPLPDEIDDPAYYFQDCRQMSLNVYRRTLAAGRKVVLCGVQPFQVPQIFSAVGCDGVFIQTGCPTRREADDLIALARKEWIR